MIVFHSDALSTSNKSTRISCSVASGRLYVLIEISVDDNQITKVLPMSLAY